MPSDFTGTIEGSGTIHLALLGRPTVPACRGAVALSCPIPLCMCEFSRDVRATQETLVHLRKHQGQAPEWVGWTVTGPSPAEGCFLVAAVLLVGELAQVSQYPER